MQMSVITPAPHSHFFIIHTHAQREKEESKIASKMSIFTPMLVDLCMSYRATFQHSLNDHQGLLKKKRLFVHVTTLRSGGIES